MPSRLTNVWSVLLLCYTFNAVAETTAPGAANARYITDLGIAQPQEVVSQKNEAGKWRLLPYETRDLRNDAARRILRQCSRRHAAAAGQGMARGLPWSLES